MAIKTLDDLVNAIVANNVTLTKTAAKAILQSAFASIQAEADAGETVRIHNFGTFVNKTRAARTGRNPATGEAIAIAESTSLHFKPTKHK
jgi:nucleoid DNA-binding protein